MSLSFRRGVLVTDQDCDQNQEPDLHIAEGFKNMRPFEALVLNPSLVDADMVDADMLEHHDLAMIRKKLGLHWCIREPIRRRYPNHHHHEPQHDEHHPPAGKGFSPHLLKRKRHQPTCYLAYTQAQIPEREPGRLLRLGLPLATDEHQGRPNSGLEDTQQDPHGKEAAIVLYCSCAGRHDVPQGDVEAQPFSGREFLQEINCVGLSEQRFLRHRWLERFSLLGISAMR